MPRMSARVRARALLGRQEQVEPQGAQPPLLEPGRHAAVALATKAVAAAVHERHQAVSVLRGQTSSPMDRVSSATATPFGVCGRLRQSYSASTRLASEQTLIAQEATADDL